MPEYTMKHKETGETETMVISLSEREKFLEDNPDWTQVLAAPLLVSGVKSALRMSDDGWKENLKRIKKNSGKDNTIEL